MKNLFTPKIFVEVIDIINKLENNTNSLWGKMDVVQNVTKY